MNTKQQPQISERVYREVVSRIEHGKVPIYPSLVRRKAIERYKAEKIAEIERAKRETERKIREAQRRRETRRRREERRRYEEMKKALEASKKRVHAGHWVKIEKGGKSVSEMGIAAMSPSQAKALGYKWGTAKWNPKTGLFEFVSIPSAPSEPEYYGILKWKYESGHYKRPEVAEQIKKEIEIGAKKYGIVAPAWAGGYLKEYEQIAKQIRKAYLKATQSETKPSAIELKKALDSQSKVMQDLQRLQAQRAMLEKQIKATTHLAEEAKAKYGKYEKGGWTPEEIVKYGLLAGTVGGISKTLETQISEYNKQVQQLRESMRREQQRPVQPSVRVSIPKQTVVKPAVATKKPEIPVVYSPLMQEIKATGKVPTVHIPERTKPPSSFEASIEPIKRITGYYPEKEEALKATTSMYKKHQLDVAESLGIIHKERDTGKRYIIVNNTKYVEGTKGFDEHLGEAIQSKLSIKEPPEVKRRQEAIRSANRALSEFLKSYGGKPGEPIILTTPESKKAFEKVKATFEGIPEETTTTKAYWEEVGKIQKAQPQLQELNVLAEQATKQAKEMEKIRKESWFGIPYKIESLGEKYSPYVKKVIPPVRPYAEVKTPEDLVRAVEKTYEWSGAKLTEQQRKAIEESYIRGKKAYGTYRRMFGLPPEPFKWEKKAAQLEAGIKAGQVEEIRERPVKGAITVASFAAMPPVFKGAGAIWKGAGLATKLPRITKYAPKIILGGMGAGYTGGVGYETYKAPTLEKKGEVLGRTSVEMAEMAAGAYMGTKITEPFSFIQGLEHIPKGYIEYKGIAYKGRPLFGRYTAVKHTGYKEVLQAQQPLKADIEIPFKRQPIIKEFQSPIKTIQRGKISIKSPIDISGFKLRMQKPIEKVISGEKFKIGEPHKIDTITRHRLQNILKEFKIGKIKFNIPLKIKVPKIQLQKPKISLQFPFKIREGKFDIRTSPLFKNVKIPEYETIKAGIILSRGAKVGIPIKVGKTSIKIPIESVKERGWTPEDIKSIEEYLAMHRARGGIARARRLEELGKRKLEMKKEPYETVFTSGIAPSEIYGGAVPTPGIEMPKLSRPSHLPPEMMTSGIVKGEELKIIGYKHHPEYEIPITSGFKSKPPALARIGLGEEQWISGLTEAEKARIKTIMKPPQEPIMRELIARIKKPHVYSAEQTERLLKLEEEPKIGSRGYYQFYKKSVLTLPEDLPLQIRFKRIKEPKLKVPKVLDLGDTTAEYFRTLMESLKFPQVYGEISTITKPERILPIRVGRISSGKGLRVKYTDRGLMIGEAETIKRRMESMGKELSESARFISIGREGKIKKLKEEGTKYKREAQGGALKEKEVGGGQIVLQKTEQKPEIEEVKLTTKSIEEKIAKITGKKQPRTIYEEFKESIITKPRIEPILIWKPKIRRKVRTPALYLPSTKEPKPFKEARDYIERLEKKRTKYIPYEWQKFAPIFYEGYKFEPISLERFRTSPITATPPATPSIRMPEIRYPEIQQPKEMLKTATPEIKPPEILEAFYFPFPHEKKKRPRHRKYRRSPYEWFEYHPIPTLKEMFGIVGLPQQKPKTKHSTKELTSVINQLIGKPKL